MNRSVSVAALLCGALLSSCDWLEKNAVQDIAGPVPAGARIKFFNFGVGSPGVNFYADERKMTAIGSAAGRESPTGVTYGSVGAGGFYMAITAGPYTLSGRIADTAVDHNLPISNLPATLEAGKHYSFYQSGFYNTTAKTVGAFMVEDPFVAEIDYSVAYVRFVHAISNANPLILYATKVAPPDSGVVDTSAAVAYQAAGAFRALTPGLYNLAARYVDSTANKISRTGVSFLPGRVYTIGARGDITVTSSTATNRPFLDNTANR